MQPQQCYPPFLQTTLIHLGAKYAPCMRWDETLSREMKESRLKERDTACCIRKDRFGFTYLASWRNLLSIFD